MFLIYAIFYGLIDTAIVFIVACIVFAVMDTVFMYESDDQISRDRFLLQQLNTERKIYVAMYSTQAYLDDMIDVYKIIKQYDSDEAEKLEDCLWVIANSYGREK